MNALANHDILPHNGKGITKAVAVDAMNKAFHIDPFLASIFAAGGVAANPDHRAHSFDLDHIQKHGFIEHDVSLSRNDAALGNNTDFNKELFDKVLDGHRSYAAAPGPDTPASTDWTSACRVRYDRVLASKEAHEKEGKQFQYGLKEAIASYGETALYLSLLGNDGKVSIEWLKILFGMKFLGLSHYSASLS